MPGSVSLLTVLSLGFGLALCAAASAHAQESSSDAVSDDLEARAADLVKQMTLEEKAAYASASQIDGMSSRSTGSVVQKAWPDA